MKKQLNYLQDYPFQRLAALKQGVTTESDKPHIALSIGEPKHPAPDFVLQTLHAEQQRYGSYPATRGISELRAAITAWLSQRYQLRQDWLDPDRHVLPLAGSREGLFSIAQCLVDSDEQPLVMMPNPFYQIYEGAALLAGAQPRFMNATAGTGFLPELDEPSDAEWQRCQMIYICSPGNPTGAVCPLPYLRQLLELAEKHDFLIVADECYSEIYFDQPPPGLLQACAQAGNTEFKRCLVMNSLSKRSNLPGLRSGFVAGDAELLEKYLLYRTYHGSTIPVPAQLASAAAWADETHVEANRQFYINKFDAVHQRLAPLWPLQRPEAAFFYWAETPIDDQRFCQELFRRENITVLPGSYLSRNTPQGNPGEGRVRMALVAELDECLEAAQRLLGFLQTV